MASITETPESRNTKIAGKASTFQLLYNLREYANDSSALTALSTAVASFGTVIVDGVGLSTIELDLKPRGRLGNYSGSVDFKHESRDKSEPPQIYTGEELSFSFTDPQQTFFTRAIAQSKHNSSDPFGERARDVGLSLNVLTDGTVEGIEVNVPGDGMQIKIPNMNIGGSAAAVNAWLKARIAQRYTTNAATFRTLAAGDCMFLGFSGKPVADGLFDMQFDFSVVLGEDYTSTPLDTGLATFAIGKYKKGFDVLWVQYDPSEDTTNKVVVPKARGAYVAQVFRSSDFSAIGVNTA